MKTLFHRLWLLITFFPEWIFLVGNSFYLAITSDFILLVRSSNYYLKYFWKVKKEYLKTLLLYLYFIYPFYLFIKIMFILYVLSLKYFTLLILSLNIYYAHVFEKPKLTSFYWFLTKQYDIAALGYANFLIVFRKGVYFVVKTTVDTALENLMIIFYNNCILPSLRLLWVFYEFSLETSIYFYIKISVRIDMKVMPVIRKIIRLSITFVIEWYKPVIKFLILFFPVHIWRTFLPVLINYIYAWSYIIIMNSIYYFLYFGYVFVIVLWRTFMYGLNVLLYGSTYVVLYLVYVGKLFVFYIKRFVYVAYPLIRFVWSLVTSNRHDLYIYLQILWLDLLSVWYIIKADITIFYYMIKYRKFR